MEEDNNDIIKLVELFKEAASGDGSVYWDSNDLVLVFLACLDAHDGDTAAKALRQLETDFPNNVSTHMSKMKWLMFKHKFTDAFEELTKTNIDEIKADCPIDLAYAAQCASMNGHENEGADYFVEYINCCENFDEIFLNHYLAILSIFSLMSKNRDMLVGKIVDALMKVCKQVDLMLYSADALMLIDRNDDAISLLSELSDKDPLNPDVWKKLSLAYGKMENDEKMIESFEYFSALVPDDNSFDVLVMKVDVLIKKADYKEALKILRHCSKNQNKIPRYDDVVVNFALIKIYACLKDYKRERVCLTKYVNFRDPQYRTMWLDFASSFSNECDDVEFVVEFLNDVLEVADSNIKPSLMMLRGIKEFEKFRLNRGIKHLVLAKSDALQCLKYEPDNYVAIMIVGKTSFFLDDFKNAVKYLEKAYKLNPESDFIGRLLAISYYKNNNIIKFKRLFKALIGHVENFKEDFLSLYPESKDLIAKI
ncbi:MAG: hypothetical protein MJZ93_02770 [Paludibacteraceae bacterium]|nr:hypothetical protein [Paludibacteraceae bacterium]